MNLAGSAASKSVTPNSGDCRIPSSVVIGADSVENSSFSMSSTSNSVMPNSESRRAPSSVKD